MWKRCECHSSMALSFLLTPRIHTTTAPNSMPTERSDKLHADWRTSTEKFDYFMLGILCSICAFIAQGYEPEKLGCNPSTLELVSLITFVFAVVAGFRRIEQTLLVTGLNQRVLKAVEAKGGMIAMMSEGRMLINKATGETFTPEEAQQRIVKLSITIQENQPQLESVKKSAYAQYKLRNYLALAAFLLLLTARVWSAYA